MPSHNDSVIAGGAIPVWLLEPDLVWQSFRRRTSPDSSPGQPSEPNDPVIEQWLKEQLAARIPGYGGRLPWRGWCRPKPDLRYWRHRLYPSGVYWRIQIRKQPGEFACVCSDAWLGVRNKWYIALTRAELDEWDAELRSAHLDHLFWHQLPDPWSARVRKTWERAFDIEALSSGGLWATDRVETLFELLSQEEIVRAERFVVTQSP